jgi:hypothetical protein
MCESNMSNQAQVSMKSFEWNISFMDEISIYGEIYGEGELQNFPWIFQSINTF